MKVRFDSIEVGTVFKCNGGTWTKASSTTARLHENDRVFYFGSSELVEVGVQG